MSILSSQLTWIPRDIAECAELYKQRTHDRTVKIWGEGYIHVGTNNFSVSLLFCFSFKQRGDETTIPC